MVLGRTSEPRSVTVTTALTTAVTAPAGTFSDGDVGRRILATGIPAGATLASVTSDTAAVLSAAGTAAATVSAVIGVEQGSGPLNFGFTGWSPETDAERKSYTLAANNAGTVAPDRIADPRTPATTGRRGRG